MDILKMTIEEAFAFMNESNAGYIAASINDAEGNPMSAIILVQGYEETKEIIDAADAIRDSWHADNDSEDE